MTEDTNLPRNLACYCASPYIPPPNDYPPGSTTEYLNFSPQKRRLLFTPVSSPESVLVCGWRAPENDHDRSVPEIWRFFLFPYDRIVCLNIEATDDFRRQRAHFHYFAAIGRSIYLLGSEDEEDQTDMIHDGDKLLDVCLELTIQPTVP